MSNLNLMSGTGFNGQGVMDSVAPWVNLGLWLLLGFCGLVAAIKTGLCIFKWMMAADDPELRAQLKSSIWLPLGCTIGFFAVPTIVNAVFAAMGYNLSISFSPTG
ncbi:hypothetical protein [Spiroplasma sp. DGKH1]|uniref:hypothetical protein n=1 Tax=Spiroplasma sp. DGKH1 TaxID=3050074 RepID=UPI0034C62693